jgi:hypothetical protein
MKDQLSRREKTDLPSNEPYKHARACCLSLPGARGRVTAGAVSATHVGRLEQLGMQMGAPGGMGVLLSCR